MTLHEAIEAAGRIQAIIVQDDLGHRRLLDLPPKVLANTKLDNLPRYYLPVAALHCLLQFARQANSHPENESQATCQSAGPSGLSADKEASLGGAHPCHNWLTQENEKLRKRIVDLSEKLAEETRDRRSLAAHLSKVLDMLKDVANLGQQVAESGKLLANVEKDFKTEMLAERIMRERAERAGANPAAEDQPPPQGGFLPCGTPWIGQNADTLVGGSSINEAVPARKVVPESASLPPEWLSRNVRLPAITSVEGCGVTATPAPADQSMKPAQCSTNRPLDKPPSDG